MKLRQPYYAFEKDEHHEYAGWRPDVDVLLSILMVDKNEGKLRFTKKGRSHD